LAAAKRLRAILTAVTIPALMLTVLHAYSLEGIDGWFFSRFPAQFPQDTQYAPGFTDAAFRRLRKRMTEADVARQLPQPLGEVWIYSDGQRPAPLVGFTSDVVDHVDADRRLLARVQVGATKREVLGQLGEPREKTLVYSRRPTDVSYHVRVVLLRDGRVAERISEFYVD
jgi:hypothetical protein